MLADSYQNIGISQIYATISWSRYATGQTSITLIISRMCNIVFML